jgi:diguanylate cyclase (GGDEF)-like protein/PAS domain S-box-containing protein
MMRDVGTDGHQLDLMYRRFPHAIMSAMVLSSIMVAAMWWSVPHRALLGWLGLIWGIALLNGVHTWRYLTLGALQPEPGRWKKWVALGTAASGLSWGLAVVWLPQSVNDPAMLSVIFCLAGVTAYSTTWLAAFPYVLFVYQCAALIPLILRLATSGEPFYVFLSVSVVFYLMTMVGLARHLREAVDEAFRTHAHNRKLQDALAQVAGLERENALFRCMVEATHDPAIFIMRPEDNGHFYYINEAVCQHFGASREEVMKWHVSDWDPHFDAQKGKQLWQTLAQQESKSMRFETEHILASGELVPVEVTLNLAEYAGERFTVGYFRNIAKQKADAAHMRQLELEALRAAGERSFRDVFNQFGEGIFLLDATEDGRFKVAALNPAAERLVGLSDAAARGRFTEALFPEPFASHLSQHDRRCVETGQPVDYEEKFDLPAGKRRYSITLVPLRDASGKVTRLAGVMRDITAAKALENALRERAEMERRLNTLVSNAPGFFYTLKEDEDGQYSMPFASAGIRDLYGVPPEAVAADIESIHDLAYPDDQEYLMRRTFESARNLTPFQAEFRVRHPEKGEIWVEARSTPERLPDGGTVWHGFMHEITARKRTEEQLRLKEFVLDTARDAVYIVGDDLRFSYVNREACRALGYSREELLQMTPFDIDPDCTDETLAAVEEGSITAVSPGTYVIERRHRRRDGSTFPVEITAFTEIFEDRALGITVVRDLTERKRAEAELIASESATQVRGNLLSAVMESSPDVIVFALDRSYCYLAFNHLHQKAMQAIWGCEIEIGMSMLDAIGREDDREKARQACDRALSGESFVEEAAYGDEALHREFWQIFWSPIREDSGEVTGLTCFVLNVSKRRRLEFRAENERARLRGFFAAMPDLAWIKDMEGRYLACNPVFEKLFGASEAEIVGKTDFDFVDAELAAFFRRKDAEAIAADVPCVNEEWVTFAVDGRRALLETTKMPLRDAQGRIVGVLGVAHDITERQCAADKLARSSAFMNSVVDSIGDAIFVKDRAHRWVAMNKACCELIGHPREALLGKSDFDYFPEEIARGYWEADEQVFTSGLPDVREEPIPDSQGNIRTIITSKYLFTDDTEQQFIVASIRDITQRKHAEDAIQELNAELSATLQAIPDLMFEFDQDGRYVGVWARDAELLAAVKNSLIGKTVLELLGPEADALSRTIMREADEQGYSNGHTFCMTEPRGERWYEYSASVKQTQKPGERRYVMLARDITERKQMEYALVEREREFRSLAENLPDNVVRFDLDGRIKYVNPQFANMLGRAPAELTEKMLEEVMPSCDNVCLPALHSVLQTGEPVDVEFKLPAADGLVHTHHVRFSAERDNTGKMIGALAVGHDITVRKTLEEMLVQREYEFRTLVEHSPDTIARYDEDCRRIYVNPSFAEMAGDETHLLGKKPSEFPGGEESSAYEEKIREVLASGNDAEFELVWTSEDGQRICSLIHLTPERDQSGRIASVLAVGRDITELNEYREKIHALAFYDTLTQLPNRVLFNDRMRLMLADAERHAHLAAVMLLDLDRFKEINDTLGHAAGDELLREAGARLMHCVRNYDTVARLGGDEFAILLPQVRAANDLTTIANKMLAAFATPFLLGEKEIFVSTSIGIALYPDDSTAGDDLLKFADSAMYHAKRSGRNNFRFYSKELSASANERLALESDLRKALARGELELHYQPKVSLEDTALAGSEALLRWRHPVRGMVPPDRFIRIAEDSGLIVEIGEWVLQTACAVARKWNGEGKPLHKVAVNLSARQFVSNDLVGSVRRMLDEAGCRPEWIELEITESLLLEGDGEILETLQALRDMGITIAIDDFGTGYSALSYLTRFPIHTLKIDRSFTRHVDSGGHHAELVKAIISLARCLNLEVVAEGVETGEQEAFLKSCGCQTVQGYWYGKPVPEHEFKNFLATPFSEAG